MMRTDRSRAVVRRVRAGLREITGLAGCAVVAGGALLGVGGTARAQTAAREVEAVGPTADTTGPMVDTTGPTANSPGAPPDTARLRTAIESILDRHGAPGAGVALVAADGPVWVAGVGLADRAAGRPATAGTVFRAGSVSKSFVALAALKLQEEGRLDLDTPARDIVPEIPIDNPWAETDPVRLVHLLEHTAGLDDLHLVEYGDQGPDITLFEGLTRHPDSKVVRWRPGTRYSYSNSGPAIVAYAIEKVTGRTFEDYVRETIFEPLGMHASDFLPSDRVADRLATGYAVDGATPVPYVHIGVRPSGALNTTAADLARLVELLLGRGALRGARLLPESAIERMERPTTTHAARAGIRVGYGLGNSTTIHDGFNLHGHGGGINGFTANYGYLPEVGLGYVVLVNAQSGAAGEIARLLRSAIVHGRKASPGPVATVSAERLAALAGYYEPVSPRNESSRFLSRIFGIARVRAEDGGLTLTRPGGAARTLVPAGENVFRLESDPVPTVLATEEDGRAVLQGGPVAGTMARIPAWSAWLRRGLAAGSVVLMLSSLGFALVWAPRVAFGRLRGAPHLGARLLPALAAASLFGAAFLFAGASADLNRAAAPTAWSVGIWLLTLVFAAFTIAALVKTVRVRRDPMIHRGVRLHGLAVSAACAIVLLYLGYYGIIGVRTWSM